MGFKIDIVGKVKKAVSQIEAEFPSRAFRASNELRNAALLVLRAKGSGRVYGGHRASAPGEPPARRTGALQGSWRPVQYGSMHQSPAIESNIPYAWLNDGSPGGMIKPRPYAVPIVEKATPAVEAIYSEPYKISL